MSPRADAWAVIAAYDEVTKIAEVVRGVREVAGGVVVVDDGSSDGTPEAAHEAGAWVLRHPVNLGQGAALQTGIAFALGRGAAKVATFDADGQHRAEDLAAMFDVAGEEGAQVVLGSRFLGEAIGIPPLRRWLLRGASLLTRLTTGAAVTDPQSGLRVFTREAAAALEIRQNRMAHASEILEDMVRKGFAIREVPATVHYTEYSLGKGQSTADALNVLVELGAGWLSR